MTDETDTQWASTAGYGPEALQAMFEMSAPQDRYKTLIEQGGFVEPMDGMALSFSRDLTEFVLRHHDLFSSRVDMNLGNVRPMIPLNVDPPQPLEVPQAARPALRADADGRAGGRHHPARQRLHRHVHRRRRVQLHRGVRRAVPVVGVPRPHRAARRRDADVPPSSRRHPALRRRSIPARSTIPRSGSKVQQATGQEIYEYFGNLVDERVQQPTNDIVSRFLAAEIDGEKLTQGRHPRHLLPVPDRRARHGQRLAHVLLRVPRHAPRAPATDRRRPVDHPGGSGGVAALGVTGAGRRAAGRDRRHRAAERRQGCRGHRDRRQLRRRERRPELVARRPSTCASTARRTRTSRSAPACTAAWASHLARRELRVTLREWHRRIPEYRIKPGHEQLEYPPGLRHVKDLTLSWG